MASIAVSNFGFLRCSSSGRHPHADSVTPVKLGVSPLWHGAPEEAVLGNGQFVSLVEVRLGLSALEFGKGQSTV